MFVRTKKLPSGRTQIQIVDSVRKGNQVKQKCIRSLGTAQTEKEISEMRSIGEKIICEMKNAKKPVLPIFDPYEIHLPKRRKQQAGDDVKARNLKHEQTINDGICDVFGKIYQDLGFNRIFNKTKKDQDRSAFLEAMVLSRIIVPQSKMASCKTFKRKFAVDIPPEQVYRMMDHLYTKEQEVKTRIGKTTLGLFKEQVDVLFFDVTTLYFESLERDELREFGFSKDCKFKESQIVLALVTTTDGLPISYRVFPGNMYEGHTLIEMIKDLRQQFDIENVLLVADRAMFSEENIALMEQENIKYIVASKLRSLSKIKRKEILDCKNFHPTIVNNEFHWLNEFEYKGRRLIVSYSSVRAKKDRAQRLRLVERLLKKVQNKTVKLTDIIPNNGTKKFLKIIGGEAIIDYNKIEKDAEWDGLHGVITNAGESATSILERYRGLWQIEEAFRVNKHSLKMRPIYHWTPKRIKAHIIICFLAYTLVKQALYKLKQNGLSLSFEQLKEELLCVDSILLKDRITEKRYTLPTKTHDLQKKTYRCFHLQRDDRLKFVQ